MERTLKFGDLAVNVYDACVEPRNRGLHGSPSALRCCVSGTMALGDFLNEAPDEIIHPIDPFAEPLCENTGSAQTQGQTNPSSRILFVDDSIAVREASAKVLIRSGYHVDVADDGEAGWKALHAASYDLLITDHSMPKLSGVELVKKLRSAHMKLPVVLASAALPTEELSLIPWLQFAATLLKPFTIDELLQTVKAVLGGTHNAGIYTGSSFPVLAEVVIPIESPQWRSQPLSDDMPQNG